MTTASFPSDSAAQTRHIAACLGAAIDPVPRGGLVVGLHGDLGAGKTVFAGGLIGALGIPAGTVVASPTFTVFRSYRGRALIEHVDAYMVNSRSALEGAGLHEIGGNGHVTCVEWAERIADALPKDRIDVDLQPIPQDPAHPIDASRLDVAPPRRIEARAGGAISARILERWVSLVAASTSEVS